MGKERKAFIATPAYGNRVLLPHMLSAMQLLEQLNARQLPYEYMTLGNESHVIRARNTCAASFLESDCTDLFFIDADIDFSVDDFRKIWNLHAPVAVGVYRMKKEGSGFAAWKGGELVTDLDDLREPFAVDHAGTGFMRIHRDVFEDMIKRGDAPWHVEGDELFDSWRFFHSDVIPESPPLEPWYCPEDYWFCREAYKLGHEVWMDPSVKLGHWGDYRYG